MEITAFSQFYDRTDLLELDFNVLILYIKCLIVNLEEEFAIYVALLEQQKLRVR